MNIIVTARHTELTDEFKDYLNEKASKLERFYDRIHEINAVVAHEAGSHEVELIVRADHKNRFVAKERHSDAFAALDKVIDEMGGQLRKHKEKHRNRKHSGPSAGGSGLLEMPDGSPSEVED
jgi:putative sigma-54 modulation protein